MGGQAVMEGVMMRGENSYAVAVRRMNGDIDLKVFDVPSFAQKFVKIPFLRGVMGLGEAMALGYRALMHSADLALKDEEEKIRKQENEKKLAKGESIEEDKPEEESKGLGKFAVGLSVTFSLCFFIGLFIITPVLASKWIEGGFNLSHWQAFIIESVLRLTIFLGYLSLVGLIPDIRKVFQYHGAEHKTIAAYENGVVLTPKSAQQFTTAHVRCGTNFLLIVMVMSIVFYAGIAAFLPGIPVWGLILSRVLVIPLIAGVSYEIIRGAATRMDNFWIRTIIRPGLLLQKITTRQPSDDQVEVAITSLNAVFTEEQIKDVQSRTVEIAKPTWQVISRPPRSPQHA